MPNKLENNRFSPDLNHARLPFAGESGIRILPSMVLDAVSAYFDVSVDDLLGRTRRGEVVYARHIAMYTMRQCTRETLVSIARRFDRNHGTVISALKKISIWMELLDYCRTDYQNIIADLDKKSHTSTNSMNH